MSPCSHPCWCDQVPPQAQHTYSCCAGIRFMTWSQNLQYVLCPLTFTGRPAARSAFLAARARALSSSAMVITVIFLSAHQAGPSSRRRRAGAVSRGYCVNPCQPHDGCSASARTPTAPSWLHCHQPVMLRFWRSGRPQVGHLPVATMRRTSAWIASSRALRSAASFARCRSVVGTMSILPCAFCRDGIVDIHLRLLKLAFDQASRGIAELSGPPSTGGIGELTVVL